MVPAGCPTLAAFFAARVGISAAARFSFFNSQTQCHSEMTVILSAAKDLCIPQHDRSPRRVLPLQSAL
jgi:hypothetical protein